MGLAVIAALKLRETEPIVASDLSSTRRALAARLVIAGVCLQEDGIMPIFGTNEELSVQFVLGYAPGEFATALQAIADGRINVQPLVTGKVGLAGVAQAFASLATPDDHAKILVELWRD